MKTRIYATPAVKGLYFCITVFARQEGQGGRGDGGTLSGYNYTVHNNYKIENSVNICTGIKCFNCLK